MNGCIHTGPRQPLATINPVTGRTTGKQKAMQAAAAYTPRFCQAIVEHHGKWMDEHYVVVHLIIPKLPRIGSLWGTKVPLLQFVCWLVHDFYISNFLIPAGLTVHLTLNDVTPADLAVGWESDDGVCLYDDSTLPSSDHEPSPETPSLLLLHCFISLFIYLSVP